MTRHLAAGVLRANHSAGAPVQRPMTFLKKLLGGKAEPKTRVRICVECGIEHPQHKEWCSILRGQKEMEQKAAAR